MVLLGENVPNLYRILGKEHWYLDDSSIGGTLHVGILKAGKKLIRWILFKL